MIKRRWRSRNPRVSSRKRFVFLCLVVMLLFALQSFIFIDRNLKPPLVALASVRLKQIATQSINEAISDRIAQGDNFDKLLQWKTDNNGKVTGVMFNSSEQMKITADAVSTVQGLLGKLQSMPEHIPLGQAMHSAILASFGPEIPVRLVPEGSVKVDLNTRYENAGINMILVEVYIRIIAEVAIIVPFDSAPETVETELPISYALVVGDTPMYYVDSKGNPIGSSAPLPPSVSLPPLDMNGGAGAGGGVSASGVSTPGTSVAQSSAAAPTALPSPAKPTR